VNTKRERRRIPIEDLVDSPVEKIAIQIGEQVNYMSGRLEGNGRRLTNLEGAVSNLETSFNNHLSMAHCGEDDVKKARGVMFRAIARWAYLKAKSHPKGTTGLGGIGVLLLGWWINAGMPGLN